MLLKENKIEWWAISVLVDWKYFWNKNLVCLNTVFKIFWLTCHSNLSLNNKLLLLFSGLRWLALRMPLNRFLLDWVLNNQVYLSCKTNIPRYIILQRIFLKNILALQLNNVSYLHHSTFIVTIILYLLTLIQKHWSNL